MRNAVQLKNIIIKNCTVCVTLFHPACLGELEAAIALCADRLDTIAELAPDLFLSHLPSTLLSRFFFAFNKPLYEYILDKSVEEFNVLESCKKTPEVTQG